MVFKTFDELIAKQKGHPTMARMAGMLLRWEMMKVRRVSQGSWRRMRMPAPVRAASCRKVSLAGIFSRTAR